MGSGLNRTEQKKEKMLMEGEWFFNTTNFLEFYKCHPKDSTHLYDYEGAVDDDLICHLCFQPFVNPIDTKCGCTYCSGFQT